MVQNFQYEKPDKGFKWDFAYTTILFYIWKASAENPEQNLSLRRGTVKSSDGKNKKIFHTIYKNLLLMLSYPGKAYSRPSWRWNFNFATKENFIFTISMRTILHPVCWKKSLEIDKNCKLPILKGELFDFLGILGPTQRDFPVFW